MQLPLALTHPRELSALTASAWSPKPCARRTDIARPSPLAPEFPVDSVRAIARHKVSGKFRRILHKTNDRRPLKVSHFFMAGLPVSSATPKGGRARRGGQAWEIATLPNLRDEASGSRINRHNMPSPVRPNSFKTKVRGHREPSHFFAKRYLEKRENLKAPA
jgi:hypothetical protein